MAYPPDIPTGTRIDSTPLTTTHPDEHNTVNAALTDIVAELGSDPSAGEVDVETRLDRIQPVGAMMDFAGTAAPPGWLVCDGAAYNGGLPQFAELFAVIGNTWGGADATDFEVPDFSGRSAIGKQTSGIGAAVGETGGQSVVMEHLHTNDFSTATQNANHEHGFAATTGPDGAHGHNLGEGELIRYYNAGGGEFGYTGAADRGQPYANSSPYQTTGANGGDHTHTVGGTTEGISSDHQHEILGSIHNTGSGANNMNPYATVLKIIYAGTIPA